MIRQILAMAVSLAALVGANAALAQAAPLLDVTLKPGAADAQGHVAFVDIVTRIPAADTPAGATLLALPGVVANVEGVAKRRESELEKESSSDVDMAEILQAQAKRAEATEANSFEQQLVNLHDNHDFELPPEEDMDEKHRKFLEED